MYHFFFLFRERERKLLARNAALLTSSEELGRKIQLKVNSDQRLEFFSPLCGFFSMMSRLGDMTSSWNKRKNWPQAFHLATPLLTSHLGWRHTRQRSGAPFAAWRYARARHTWRKVGAIRNCETDTFPLPSLRPTNKEPYAPQIRNPTPHK